MIEAPDRITPLILRLEAGETITQSEVNRLAVLQALDLVVIGQQFARQAAISDAERTEEYREHLEQL